MSDRRRTLVLLASGLVLLALGLCCWASGLDQPLHDLLRLAPGGPWPHRIARLSELGGFGGMGPLALAVVIALAVFGRWRRALWLFATIASGRLVVEAVKLLVHRPRPPLADRLASVDSWSFPSSHAAGTMATMLALALLAGDRPPATAAALAVALFVGWTRVALAVHWPSDVLAGWGIGVIWIGAAAMALPRRT